MSSSRLGGRRRGGGGRWGGMDVPRLRRLHSTSAAAVLVPRPSLTGGGGRGDCGGGGGRRNGDDNDGGSACPSLSRDASNGWAPSNAIDNGVRSWGESHVVTKAEVQPDGRGQDVVAGGAGDKGGGAMIAIRQLMQRYWPCVFTEARSPSQRRPEVRLSNQLLTRIQGRRHDLTKCEHPGRTIIAPARRHSIVRIPPPTTP
jgi:hypothetical protein